MKTPAIKLTVTYAAGGHSAVESSLSTLLSTLREQFPDAVAYASGGEVEINDDLTIGTPVYVWENEASSINDDGARAIAKITVAAHL